MIYCGQCRTYVATCQHSRAQETETRWGWVVFVLFLAMAGVAWLGTCA